MATASRWHGGGIGRERKDERMFGPNSRVELVVGYVFAADLWCHACVADALFGPAGTRTVASIETAIVLGEPGDSEYDWDSDDYPKPVFDYQAHDSCYTDECWDRCGTCGEPLGDTCYAAEVWERQGENDGV